jgi:hypothetical protein
MKKLAICEGATMLGVEIPTLLWHLRPIHRCRHRATDLRLPPEEEVYPQTSLVHHNLPSSLPTVSGPMIELNHLAELVP